jgi:hypothetical protein
MPRPVKILPSIGNLPSLPLPAFILPVVGGDEPLDIFL